MIYNQNTPVAPVVIEWNGGEVHINYGKVQTKGSLGTLTRSEENGQWTVTVYGIPSVSDEEMANIWKAIAIKRQELVEGVIEKVKFGRRAGVYECGGVRILADAKGCEVIEPGVLSNEELEMLCTTAQKLVVGENDMIKMVFKIVFVLSALAVLKIYPFNNLS